MEFTLWIVCHVLTISTGELLYDSLKEVCLLYYYSFSSTTLEASVLLGLVFGRQGKDNNNVN